MISRNRTFESMESRAAATVEQAQEKATQAAAAALESLENAATESIRRVEKFVSERPAASLAIAISVGVCLGWLLKRR